MRGRAFVALDEPRTVRYARGRRRGPSEPDAREVFARLPEAPPAFAWDRARGRVRTDLGRVTRGAPADRARRGRRCDRVASAALRMWIIGGVGAAIRALRRLVGTGSPFRSLGPP
jgi:hypothetical protein